jgi:hypothetical protein
MWQVELMTNIMWQVDLTTNIMWQVDFTNNIMWQVDFTTNSMWQTGELNDQYHVTGGINDQYLSLFYWSTRTNTCMKEENLRVYHCFIEALGHIHLWGRRTLVYIIFLTTIYTKVLLPHTCMCHSASIKQWYTLRFSSRIHVCVLVLQ